MVIPYVNGEPANGWSEGAAKELLISAGNAQSVPECLSD